MQSIERRIAALESQSVDRAMKVISIRDGETEADAMRRAGLPLAIQEYASVVFVSTLDARI